MLPSGYKPLLQALRTSSTQGLKTRLKKAICGRPPCSCFGKVKYNQPDTQSQGSNFINASANACHWSFVIPVRSKGYRRFTSRITSESFTVP